jgi:hypothetical protein
LPEQCLAASRPEGYRSQALKVKDEPSSFSLSPGSLISAVPVTKIILGCMQLSWATATGTSIPENMIATAAPIRFVCIALMLLHMSDD